MSDSVPAPRLEGGGPSASRDSGSLDDTADRADRYIQERELGRGAMGAVYLVRDRETGERLALKKLFRMDGKSVLRLKREFRSLSDMSHPNLVKVYELGRSGEGWFLAMELVEGEELPAYLGLSPEQNTVSRVDAAVLQLASYASRLRERVLPAFYQLASGVHALHRAGMLHRDLKPSNVLVANHRVVVLDFGLVRELDPDAPELTEEGVVTGTPGYMAPEQALGKPLSEASDWYAFGAMLYEALTGELPFEGTVFEVLRHKLEQDPLPPHELNPSVPARLSALCMALLARDPSARPKGSDVMARLEPVRPQLPSISLSATGNTSLLSDTQAESVEPRFFGRDAEVQALWDAQRKTETGQTVVVHVRGISGAGKSALVEQFLDQVERESSPSGQTEALVLRSRCYEREAMPYKALDGVIDALGRHLARLDDFDVSHLLPTDISVLAQLFPVLERLRAVQRLLTRRSAGGDAVHNRQRAEAALQDLISRLSARRPVVIWIDDLQWGDLDSAGILKGWLQRTAGVPLLLVLSYRSDEVETSECLRVLLPAASEHTGAAITQTLEVAALAATDVQALCRQQLGINARNRDALIARIVREADGSPFLAAQLTALVEARLARGEANPDAISIGDLVAQTTAMLSAEARHLLAVLAVAGRPMLPKPAFRAAGIRHGGREVVHALRRLQLVRTRAVAGERLLEVYHDRVREGVQRTLSASQLERTYASLLAALEYSGRVDPDFLHMLALGANQPVAAFRYGLVAAERATVTLAFERAVELYTRCLELGDALAQDRGELYRKLADALGWCGRGGMAADAYLEAAKLATPEDALPLMRLATSHLLRSGRFEEGEAMLQRVLEAMALTVPKTDKGLIAAIVWERCRGAMRGLRYTPRNEGETPAALLARIDAYDALRYETVSIDPLRAALFFARGLRWTLEAGEPTRVLRALCGACYAASTEGTARAERRTDALLAKASALGEQIGTETARAAVCGTRAMVSWMLGRPKAVLEPSYEAERLYRSLAQSQVDGNYYMRLAIASTRIGALYELSDYRAFAAQMRAILDEVHATGNRAARLQLAINETTLEEILDHTDKSIPRLEQQRQELPRGRFGLYHALHMISVMHAAYTTGHYDWGLRYMEEDWPRFVRSPLRRSATLGFFATGARVRLLLSSHLMQSVHGARLPARITSELDAARVHPGDRTVSYDNEQRARISHAQAKPELAVVLLRGAIEHWPGLADRERCRYALGLMVGGDEGETLRVEAERQLSELGIVNPANYVRGYFPELLPR